MVPGLPSNEGNYHLVLINLSKINLFWCPFFLFPFLVWCFSMKDFAGKWFLSVDGCNKAHTVTKLTLLSQWRHLYGSAFFIKDEEQKTNPLKHHYCAMEHNKDHILTCTGHEKLSQQCLQLPSFGRENGCRQSSCGSSLLLSTTALERVSCTLKLLQS